MVDDSVSNICKGKTSSLVSYINLLRDIITEKWSETKYGSAMPGLYVSRGQVPRLLYKLIKDNDMWWSFFARDNAFYKHLTKINIHRTKCKLALAIGQRLIRVKNFF